MIKFGRRNFLILGSILLGVSNFGFIALHFIDGENVFIIGFTLLRLLQGWGTGWIQTANYSILSLMYPTQVEFVWGCLEAAAGIGLCFGPILAIPLYEIGGYVGPFILFLVIFLGYAFMIKTLIPAEVDDLEVTITNTSNYSLSKMFRNKRILFANIALIVNIFQYTFIDPFLANWMNEGYGYSEKIAGLLFFILGIGYATAWQWVYKTLAFLSFRRWFYVFFVLNALWTMMYGPTELLPISKSIFVFSIFILFGGITSAHTIIPTLPEILEAGREELKYPIEVLNDFSSGIFNMSFALGEIFGPFIGNLLYVGVGFSKTWDYISFGILIFAFIYFISWDSSMPWNAKHFKTQKTNLIYIDNF